MSRRLSLRAAIDAKCKSCIYDQGHGGTWREQVGECGSSNCPLHPVRPMPTTVKGQSSAQDDAGEQEPTDTPEESVSALLGSVFGPQGAE